MISHERLKELVHYDPETGIFTSKVKMRSKQPDSALGTPRPDGYLNIGVDYGVYLAHRLAWFYMTGEWPARQIDHRNKKKSDNRFKNLREATNTQNHRNKPSYNLSGLKGVSKSKNRWMARIKVNGTTIFLGRHASKERAHEAYCAAAAKYFGEFKCLETYQ